MLLVSMHITSLKTDLRVICLNYVSFCDLSFFSFFRVCWFITKQHISCAVIGVLTNAFICLNQADLSATEKVTFADITDVTFADMTFSDRTFADMTFAGTTFAVTSLAVVSFSDASPSPVVATLAAVAAIRKKESRVPRSTMGTNAYSEAA